MLYVDLPSPSEIGDLASQRNDVCVSIFLPTTPVTAAAEADRMQLKNLARQAVGQAEASGADKRRLRALAEELDDLVDDDEFWRFQAHGLVVYATPDNLRTFRVPSALGAMVAVSDRFHLKPLLRFTTFPHSCYVLALAAGGVRLLEVSADLPTTPVKLGGMPQDAASAAGKASISGRAHSGRLVGSEGQTVRLRQYARKVDAALRPLLAGGETPLVLAAAEPIGPIFRSVNSYPHLAAAGIDGNPERRSDEELGMAARGVLDELYRRRVADLRSLFERRANEGRSTADIAQAARAATFGGIQTLLVDMDRAVPGSVDETDGSVAFADRESADSYGVVDEIARRVLLSGGRVLSVRAADLPAGAPLAAILRYPL
jgi:hypothetical protein